MRESHNQTVGNSQNIKDLSSNCDDIFLPPPIVKIIGKIAKAFDMSSVDEFSILETLHYAMLKNITALDNHADEKTITVFILNIIRISDKYNKAGSTLSQAKLESFLAGLGVTIEELNQWELGVFKSIGFEVQQSETVSLIYDLIETLLTEQDNQPLLFEIALDVLRSVYFNASDIYEEYTRDQEEAVAIELKQNKLLLASAVFMVLMKLLCVSDRAHNQKFDSAVGRLDHPQAAAMLNQLAAIIFKFILAQ